MNHFYSLPPPPPASTVSQVTSRLREIEDYNLAHRLQQEEFDSHYDRNRSERRTMGTDTRVSKEEQELEKRFAFEKRLQEARDIAEHDELLARQLQAAIEEEERRIRDEQARLDEALAREMMAPGEGEQLWRPAQEEDELLARRLQERYEQGRQTPPTRAIAPAPPAPALGPQIATPNGFPPLPAYVDVVRNPPAAFHPSSTELPVGSCTPSPPPPAPTPTGDNANLIESLHPTNPFLRDLIVSQNLYNDPGPCSSTSPAALAALQDPPRSSSRRTLSPPAASGGLLPPPSELFYRTGNYATERQTTSTAPGYLSELQTRLSEI